MEDEHSYLERRFEQEKAAALRVACPSARVAHEELARYFGLRLKFCPAAAVVVPEGDDPPSGRDPEPAATDIPLPLDPVLVPST